MPPEERRRLIESPITVRVYGSRTWAGQNPCQHLGTPEHRRTALVYPDNGYFIQEDY